MNDEIKPDRNLQFRMLVVFGLIIGVTLVFSTIAGFLMNSYVIAILIVVSMVSIQFLFGHKIAIKSYGAKKVTNDTHPELHSIVTRVCQQADIEKPDIAVSNANMMNAFAAGRSPSNATVCLTTSLIDNLSEDELEAVIAHEVAHIKNRDVAIMTAAGAILALTGIIMRSVFYSAGFGRQRDVRALLIMFLVSAITYVISFILIRALSRYREYVADRSAAIITGKPMVLAEALSTIDDEMDNMPKEDLREAEGVSALMISPVKTKINTVISTHPKTEDRIKKLEEMSKDI